MISNVGSFGPGIIKIGMTRRLEPYVRVRELGDASVPFRYDLHALVFSQDAVALEGRLHDAFEDRRVNLVNTAPGVLLCDSRRGREGAAQGRCLASRVRHSARGGGVAPVSEHTRERESAPRVTEPVVVPDAGSPSAASSGVSTTTANNATAATPGRQCDLRTGPKQ